MHDRGCCSCPNDLEPGRIYQCQECADFYDMVAQEDLADLMARKEIAAQENVTDRHETIDIEEMDDAID